MTTLSDAVLWRIFMLNASDLLAARVTAIKTTRYSSQVCQCWRDIILNSTSLWGRLVLIDFRENKCWIEEILRRSGSSPLWIHGAIPNPHRLNPLSPHYNPMVHFRELFFDVIEKHWERVELLDISYHTADPREEETMWKKMELRAPSLKVFSVLGDNRSGPLVQARTALFSGDAPLLHTLNAGIFTLPPPIGLPNLRNLVWDVDNTIVDTSTLFTTLRQLTKLESISLKTWKITATPSHTALYFPALIRWESWTTLELFNLLTRNLRTSPKGCYTKVYIRGGGINGSSLYNFEQLAVNIARIIKVYMSEVGDEKHNSSLMTIKISPDFIELRLGMVSEISIESSINPMLKMAAVDIFLSTLFKSCDLTIFRELELQLLEDVSQKIFFEIPDVLAIPSLNSIKGLKASLSFFQAFYESRKQEFLDTQAKSPNSKWKIIEKFLPNLQTISTDMPVFSTQSHFRTASQLWNNPPVKTSEAEALLQFLRMRKQINRPLSRVVLLGDVPEGDDIRRLCDMLDEVHGLEVVWYMWYRGKMKMETYLCGGT